MKTALITGGSGFIGRHLCTELLAHGWQLQVLTRDAARAGQVLPESVSVVESPAAATPASAVVNLAGEDIAGTRWSAAQKRRLVDSRLRVTRQLVEAMADWPQPPAVLVSGSAVGYYGARGDDVLDEDEPPGDEFQSRLCAQWETAARRAEPLGTRVCRIRTGLVLDTREGALSYMITPFRFGLGGHLGDGRQFLSWIHIGDAVRAIRFLLETPGCRGAYNLSAPHPVTNRQFTQTLAQALHRPRLGWVPGPLLRLLVGERARLMLTGQRVLPAALQQAGFAFEHDTLAAALDDLLADTG